jgi:TolA-binding protein
VTTEYAESNKAPDALFKTAVAYEKAGDLGVAKTTLEEVISRYPYSGPAASAKLELKRIRY